MNTFSYLLGVILIFIGSCSGDEVADGGNGRETLEIIIGGGIGGYTPSPSPESPDCPPPPPPPVPECPAPLPPPPPPPPPPEPVCPPPLPPPPPPCPPPPIPKPSPPPPSPHPPPSPRPPTPRPPTLGPVFPNLLVKRSYKAIQKFKKKIFHDPFGCMKTWDKNEGNACKYNRFACDFRPDNNKKAVASVDFNGCRFSGKNGAFLDLAEFLEEMVDVAIIHVNSNNFSGRIPDISNATKFKYLYEFDVSNNKYSCDFPADIILKTKNLTFLDLRFNSFSGYVPPSILSGLDLDVLFINNNNFQQPLPSLASKTILYLTFANNKFTGPIPKSIGNAEKLLEVLFLNNTLTGCLPYEIGKLYKSTVFDVGFNNLTGPIPHSFSCLKKMELMSLARNQLYGTVPEGLCGLPSIKNLTLSYNYFTQLGPKCQDLVKKKRLDIRMNCVLGLGNQRTAEECKWFFQRQQTCPDMRSFTYIPCENKYLDPSSLEAEYTTFAQAPSPRAYAALAP